MRSLSLCFVTECTFLWSLQKHNYLWECCYVVPCGWKSLSGSEVIWRASTNKNKETYTNRTWLHKRRFLGKSRWKITTQDYTYFSQLTQNKSMSGSKTSSFSKTITVTFFLILLDMFLDKEKFHWSIFKIFKKIF